MHTRDPIRSARLVPLIALSMASAVALARTLAGRLDRPPTFEGGLVDLAFATLAGSSGWATAILLALFLERLTRGRTRALSMAVCPRSWRPGLLAVCGVSLVLGGTAPTYAAGGTGALPRLDRPEGGPAALHRPAPVVVHRGDSLWSLTARRHPSASDAEIVRLTDALYHRNRQQIGDDPDLIQPGQRLAPADLIDNHDGRPDQ